eukprot:1161810-Pelagomonas_calceolata.AAC.17
MPPSSNLNQEYCLLVGGGQPCAPASAMKMEGSSDLPFLSALCARVTSAPNSTQDLSTTHSMLNLVRVPFTTNAQVASPLSPETRAAVSPAQGTGAQRQTARAWSAATQ